MENSDYLTMLIFDFELLIDSDRRKFIDYLWKEHKDLLEYVKMGPNERRMFTHGKGMYGEKFDA